MIFHMQFNATTTAIPEAVWRGTVRVMQLFLSPHSVSMPEVDQAEAVYATLPCHISTH